jgi:Uma2 family endonuclease
MAAPAKPLPPAPPPSPPDNPSTIPPEVLPDYDKIVVDDGAPVDNMYIEKLYRLLTEPLHTSWAGRGDPARFVAVADVGLFHTRKEPPLVPDVMVSLDVPPRPDLLQREHRSYFMWEIGKPPDVVIEIVSDRTGGEEHHKMRAYARIAVPFYVIFDPQEELQHGVLRAFKLDGGQYQPTEPAWLAKVGLGLTLWEGPFEGQRQTWLRWCDRDGQVIPTGAERAEDEKRRADSAEEKARKLAERLRSLGINPDE